MRHISTSILLALIVFPFTGASQEVTGWMGRLNENKKLSELSIPGTHDSGARHDPWFGPGTTRCQTLSIAEQLQAGVRFLDIRCANKGNKFLIYHGPINQHLSFESVLKDCYDFLQANPSECVIMSVHEDCGPSFEQTFDSYVAKNPGRWYESAVIPRLKEVRGKIVLLRRFHAEHLPKGIDATSWPDNQAFDICTCDARLRIQDCYKISRKRKKWDEIQGLYAESKAGDSNCLYLNFASGYKPVLFFIPRIKSGYGVINPQLQSYFAFAQPPIRAITIFDFGDRQICSAVINANSFP